MEATIQDDGRRGVLTRALKKFLAVDGGVFDTAVQRVQAFLGEEAARDYQKRAAGEPRPEGGWEEALRHRQLVGRPLTRKQQEEYDAAVRRDQRVARRKLFFPEKLMARASEELENQEKATVEEQCGPAGSVAANDTDLPRPTTQQGRMLEDYCKFGSWGICEKCSSLCPRPLCPMDLRRINKATIPANQCTACKHGEYVPQPEDIPAPLRNLKPRVLEALRPLEMDLGTMARVPNGYRVHTAMIGSGGSAETQGPKSWPRGVGLLAGKRRQLVQGHCGQAHGILGKAWSLCRHEAAEEAIEIH